MDRLWAPWRKNYVVSARRKHKCIFCDKKNQQDQVVFRTRYCLCMLNIFPYNNGHLLVAPLRHAKDLSCLKDEEALDLCKAVNKAKAILDRTLKPEGYNLGINIGRVSGAGIIGHLHVHIVPRWNGDTNFMPVVNKTKVISQSLEELYKQLRDAQSKVDKGFRR